MGHTENNPVFIYLEAFNTDTAKVGDFKKRYREGKVGDVEVKKYLAEVLNNLLDPIRAKRSEFEKQPDLINKILLDGVKKGRETAGETMTKVRMAMKINYF